MSKIMIYGAYGFVGREISRLAQKKGLNPILAGRDKEKVQALAKELQLDYSVFSLDDNQTLENHIKDINVIMNCAGPYIETFEPIIKACLKYNTHYLDLSGEIPVYQAIHDLDQQAKNKTAMLLPGEMFIPLFILPEFQTLKYMLPFRK